MDEKEIREAVLLYDKNEDKDPKKPPTTKAVVAATAVEGDDTPMAEATEAPATKGTDVPMTDASTVAASKDTLSGATAPTPAAPKASSESTTLEAQRNPSESAIPTANTASPAAAVEAPAQKETAPETAPTEETNILGTE